MGRKGFGDYFKELRIERGLTLRAFCRKNGFDPGNLSRLERGLLPPPASEAKLKEYAKALGLKQGSDQWYELFDRAAAERGRLPKDILADEDVLHVTRFLESEVIGDRHREYAGCFHGAQRNGRPS